MDSPPSSAQKAFDRFLRYMGIKETLETLPERKPSWEYIRYLERRQKELHQQIILWFGVAILGIAAALAISLIWTLGQGAAA